MEVLLQIAVKMVDPLMLLTAALAAYGASQIKDRPTSWMTAILCGIGLGVFWAFLHARALQSAGVPMRPQSQTVTVIASACQAALLKWLIDLWRQRRKPDVPPQ